MLIKQTTQMTDSEKIAAENSNNQFLQSLSFVAVGTIYPFAGSTIPDTFMLCDGSALDTTKYSELFSVIGYTYGGSGDSFNIPDLRGKVLVGCDSSDTSFNALGKKGGAKEVTLTVAQMPEHEGHLYQNVTDIEAVPPPIGNLAGFLNESIMTAHPSSGRGWNSVAGNEVVPAGVSRGRDQPHENMPPYMVCNYIIKVNQGISTDDFRLPIDQTYTPTSPNAQSGLATAEAVGVANDYTDKAIKSSKTYANNTFAPAIKNTVSGSVLAVHDVSPIEHSLDIKLLSDTVTDFSTVSVSRYGENLWDFYNLTGITDGYTVTKNGLTATIKDGYITIAGTHTYSGYTNIIDLGFKPPYVKFPSGTYSMPTAQGASQAQIFCSTSSGNKFNTFTMNALFVMYGFYVAYGGEGTIVNDKIPLTFISGPIRPTDYKPYIQPQTVTANADGTVEGLTSLSLDMTVMTNTEGVVIDMTYNADTKMYIDNKLAEISTAIVNNV